jgi:Domain of unknown function (DUF4157)
MTDFDRRQKDPTKLHVPTPKVTSREASPAAGSAPDGGIGSQASAILRLQRSVGNAGVMQLLSDDGDEAPSPIHDVIGQGGGTPLEAGTRSAMEQRFGQDFGDVKVHTGDKASESAAAVGANAYTVGNEIVFRAGHYDTGSPTGQRTIAHELTHVVQQRQGPVDGSDAPGGIRLSDPGDPFERAADDAASTIAPITAQTIQEEGSTSTPVVLQRDPLGDEEEIQA